MWWIRSGRWGGACLFFFLGFSLMVTSGLAQDKLVLVGSVVDIDGPSLSLLRRMYRAQPEALEAMLQGLAEALPPDQTPGRSRGQLRPHWAPITFSQREGSDDPLDVSWTQVRGARGYVAVLTEDVEGRELVWYGLSRKNQLAYPKNGPELRKGERYHLFVVPVSALGKPIGRNPVAHLGFLSPGHSPTFQTLPPPEVEVSTSPARLHWEACSGLKVGESQVATFTVAR